MRFIVVLFIGTILGYIGFKEAYSLQMESVGTTNFILQETIGIDDNHDKLVWCEIEGMCSVVIAVRKNGVDPYEYIGSANREVSITRLDEWLSVPSGYLLPRDVADIIARLVGGFISSLIMIVILTLALVNPRKTT